MKYFTYPAAAPSVRPNAILGTLLIALSSCAQVQPAPEVVKVISEKPEKKPVKIPVGTVEKGKSSGMGMDDFFSLQQTGGALIYDVRVPYYYKIDHIPGAVNWPYNQYEEQVQSRDLEIQKALAEGKKVVFYCFNLGCPEGRNVVKKVSRRGYNISVLTMGIDSWRGAGLPME